MSIVSPARPKASTTFSVQREDRLVARFEAPLPDLVAPPADPAKLTTGPDKFVARVASPGLGASSTFVGTRTNGHAYDTVVLEYGPNETRTWRQTRDLGQEVLYELDSDTSSTGYVTRSNAAQRKF